MALHNLSQNSKLSCNKFQHILALVAIRLADFLAKKGAPEEESDKSTIYIYNRKPL